MLTDKNILKTGSKVLSGLIILGFFLAFFNDSVLFTVKIYFLITTIFYLTCILNIGLYRKFVKNFDPLFRLLIEGSACIVFLTVLFIGIRKLLAPHSFFNFKLTNNEEAGIDNAFDLITYAISLGFSVYLGRLIFRDMKNRLADLEIQIEKEETMKRNSPLYQK